MNIQTKFLWEKLQGSFGNKGLPFQDKRQPSLAKYSKGPATADVVLNTLMPYLFVAEVTGVWYFGACQAIPFLYSNYGDVVITTIQALITFMGLQIVINWFCVYYVDSNYDPIRHGCVPYQEPTLQIQAEDTLSQGTSRNGRRSNNVINGKPRSVPYWSWRYCYTCNHPRPPRCHHCPLCQKCVLKRDHHCFFSRKCIGYRNLRHFTVMMFWAFLSTVMGFLHAVPFIYLEGLPNGGYSDIVPFVTFFRWIFGYAEFRAALLIIGTWFLGIFVVFTYITLSESVRCILRGNTSYEIDFNINVVDCRQREEKIQAVFGKFWILNFLVPLHWKFYPKEDPVFWPTVKQ